jgi:hypothetical protein
LGYINDVAYINFLHNAYGVVALSTLKMVQQCAAMEAIGANIPIIVTDSKTNRRLFYKGAVFTNPESLSIKKSIEDFLKMRSILHEDIKEIKSHLNEEWKNDFSELIKIIENN